MIGRMDLGEIWSRPRLPIEGRLAVREGIEINQEKSAGGRQGRSVSKWASIASLACGSGAGAEKKMEDPCVAGNNRACVQVSFTL